MKKTLRKVVKSKTRSILGEVVEVDEWGYKHINPKTTPKNWAKFLMKVKKRVVADILYLARCNTAQVVMDAEDDTKCMTAYSRHLIVKEANKYLKRKLS